MSRSTVLILGVVSVSWAAMGEMPKRDSELFNLKKVWSARLSFEKGEWESIEPKDGGGGMPGGGGGGGPGDGSGRRGEQ